MLERFTDAAREAVVLAADEARILGHDHIGTEHLLLGLVRLGDPGTAEMGLSLAALRTDVRVALGSGRGGRTIGELQFTRAAKRALDRAGEAPNGGSTGPADLLAALAEDPEAGASALIRDDTDDGDALLAMVRAADTVSARALASLGVEFERLRAAVEAVRRR